MHIHIFHCKNPILRVEHAYTYFYLAKTPFCASRMNIFFPIAKIPFCASRMHMYIFSLAKTPFCASRVHIPPRKKQKPHFARRACNFISPFRKNPISRVARETDQKQQPRKCVVVLWIRGEERRGEGNVFRLSPLRHKSQQSIVTVDENVWGATVSYLTA